MYFGRGMPVLYYGDEQGFTGDGGDKDARQDMMPSVVGSYNDDDLIGTAATTADSNFDETHPLYQSLAEFSDLLAAHPTLTRGAQLHRFSEATSGIYAFSRIERNERVEYVVALNNSESADSATFRTDSKNTTFVELWPGTGASVASDAAGNLTVDVPALGVRLYRADAPIGTPTIAPVVSITAPTAGAELLGRIEVAANLSLPGYAEVTFAVSVDGAPFEPIGTDDNAPYRVFYDVSGLAAGTPLVFKAIADNMSGAISSAKVNAVVGAEEPPTVTGFDYAVVHYNRPAGDYGDHTTGDFNDFWGLHLWGDAIAPSEATEWTGPKPFLGEDEFGRFAWIRRGGDGSAINFIVHRGDAKDTDADRTFDADAHPEIWINEGDPTIYFSQAEAQGFATIRYHRDDGDYGTPGPDYNTFWGVHLWGDAIDPAEATDWTAPKAPDGIDDYGAYWRVQLADPSQPLNFIIHRGDAKDPGPDGSFVPLDTPSAWMQSGDIEVYPSRAPRRTSPRSTTTAPTATMATRPAPTSTTSGACTCGSVRQTRIRRGPIRFGGAGSTSSVRCSMSRSWTVRWVWRTSSTAATSRTQGLTSSCPSTRGGTRCGSSRAPTRRSRTSRTTSCRSSGPARRRATSISRGRTGSRATRSCGRPAATRRSTTRCATHRPEA